MLRAWAADRGAPLLSIDCEQRLVRRWCSAAPLVIADIEALTATTPALLFDEVQHLEEAGLLIKGLIDRRYAEPILVTGSSAWDLGAKTRESLAGRATRNRLLPFSLAEVTRDLAENPPAIQARARHERFEAHVVRGGYPDVWLSSDATERAHRLLELIDAFVIRDASDLFNISRPDAFRRLMRLAAGQVGSLVNLSEWAALIGLSKDTVAAYLSILEDAHIIQMIRPFAGGKRSELTSRPKLFFVDCGLRNQLVGDLRPWADRSDRGPLLENWVFTELIKWLPQNHTLHFWRSTSGAEIDFVVAGPKRLVAVEVKASRLTRPKITRSARSFVSAYAPAKLVVVNAEFEAEGELGETAVRWVTPSRFVGALGEA